MKRDKINNNVKDFMNREMSTAKNTDNTCLVWVIIDTEYVIYEQPVNAPEETVEITENAGISEVPQTEKPQAENRLMDDVHANIRDQLTENICSMYWNVRQQTLQDFSIQ